MTNSSPAVALAWFGLLSGLLALVFWPRHGIAARLKRLFTLTDRVLAEDALKQLFHRGAVKPEELAAALGLSRRRLERVIGRLVASGLAATAGGALALTDDGRAHAVHIVRAHRLWERYLADRTGVAESQWHREAEDREHTLSPEDTDRLFERMGRPLFDPHGDPIPEAEGFVPAVDGIALTGLEPHTVAEIVHLEDEPDDAYQRLVAAGLSLGQRISVTDLRDGGLAIRADGRAIELASGDAAQVTVRPVDGVPEAQAETLADLEAGETATVVGLSAACHGPQRRRLLDLGVVPGTAIDAELASAFGDPVAYRVRGALIALRRHQAAWVLVRRGEAA